jgi:hypothetical protein
VTAYTTPSAVSEYEPADEDASAVVVPEVCDHVPVNAKAVVETVPFHPDPDPVASSQVAAGRLPLREGEAKAPASDAAHEPQALMLRLPALSVVCSEPETEAAWAVEAPMPDTSKHKPAVPATARRKCALRDGVDMGGPFLSGSRQ